MERGFGGKQSLSGNTGRHKRNLPLSARSRIRVMLSRHAGNTEQIQPCSTAGRNLPRPSAWKASDPVRIDRARSPKAQERERAPEEDHSREGA